MITQGMYRQALKLQNESALLRVAYSLNTWLTEIEDFFEKRGTGVVLNRHPLVIMLVHRLFTLTYSGGVKLDDWRIIPGIYLNALVKWLIKTINDYTGNSSWTVVNEKFLNDSQLVQWIVLRIAEVTYCESSIVGSARAMCEYMIELSEKKATHVIDNNKDVHFIDTSVMAPTRNPQRLYRTLRSFSKAIEDASVLYCITSMRMEKIPERNA